MFLQAPAVQALNITGMRGALRAACVAVASAMFLAACSSSAIRPQPTPLPANVPLLGVTQAWVSRLAEPPVGGASIAVSGSMLFIASRDGTVTALDSATGRDVWRVSAGGPLATGVGADGKFSAVITRANEVLVFDGAKLAWRARLTAQAFTAPFIAGERVFVSLADRSVHAFDAASGRKLWSYSRPSEPLALAKPGVMMAVRDTLVLGMGGSFVGLNPSNGSVRWSAAIATARGVNDVERLVDLLPGVSRVGNVLCARAFQAAIGCVDAERGALLWSRRADATEGISGDSELLFGTETDGKLIAWRRSNSEIAWQSDRLQYRSLTAPVVLGRSIVVGDSEGNLHWLSRQDGAPLNRLGTDGSAIVGAPVLVGDTLVALTQAGGVFGFRPQQ